MTVNQEIRTGVLSESTNGRPIIVDSSTNSSATPVHHITSTAGICDSMFVRVNNDSASSVTAFVVVAPSDDTSGSACDDATMAFILPRYSSTWVMVGERVEYDASLTNYHVGIYTDSTSATNEVLRVTGWFNRITQGSVTP